MADNIVSIAKLSNYSGFAAFNLTIRASVLIKSIKHDNSQHTYFYFDLVDKSGDICAVAYDEACEKYFDLIEENKTYTITGFTLDRSDKYYTSIDHPKELVLRVNSVVQFCGEVPPVNWSVESLDFDYDMELFNIAGICLNVTDTESTPSGDKLVRRVELLDTDGHRGTLAVWNEETKIFDDLDLGSHPIIMAIDVRTYKYWNNTILTTSKYLKRLDRNHPMALNIVNSLAKKFGLSNFCPGPLSSSALLTNDAI